MLKLWQNGRDLPFQNFTFPGGEAQVRLEAVPDPRESVTIEASLFTSHQIMTLLMLTDALRRVGAKDINLVAPYLPYSRQDRVCAYGEALSLKVMCDLINSQNYSRVEIWDAHSDVSGALLNNCVNVSATALFKRVVNSDQPKIKLPDWGNTVLVAPDAGARKKVLEVSKHFLSPMVGADKIRNPGTGEITGTVVYSEHIGNKNFLMIDDICDGGRTFIELAKVLRPLTNGKVDLYVTHGIFSKGPDVFGDIDTIYVANPFDGPGALSQKFVPLFRGNE